jgi:quercetin dioxygenase-like cupin family protein
MADSRTMSEFFPLLEQLPSHEIFPGVVARTFWLEQVMIALVDLAPGSVVHEHQHVHEQMGIVLKGRFRFSIGGEERLLQTGDIYRIPSNVRHRVVTLDEPTRALDVFSPPREEYK